MNKASKRESFHFVVGNCAANRVYSNQIIIALFPCILIHRTHNHMQRTRARTAQRYDKPDFGFGKKCEQLHWREEAYNTHVQMQFESMGLCRMQCKYPCIWFSVKKDDLRQRRCNAARRKSRPTEYRFVHHAIKDVFAIDRLTLISKTRCVVCAFRCDFQVIFSVYLPFYNCIWYRFAYFVSSLRT